jgi:hypothetical protein
MNGGINKIEELIRKNKPETLLIDRLEPIQKRIGGEE